MWRAETAHGGVSSGARRAAPLGPTSFEPLVRALRRRIAGGCVCVAARVGKKGVGRQPSRASIGNFLLALPRASELSVSGKRPQATRREDMGRSEGGGEGARSGRAPGGPLEVFQGSGASGASSEPRAARGGGRSGELGPSRWMAAQHADEDT